MSIELIDLKTQYNNISTQINDAIQRVLEHGNYIMGEEVYRLEKNLEAFCSVKHAISCSNGTDALIVAMLALNLNPGDAVFVPSFTFPATAEAITILGGIPIFVDCDYDTFNIDAMSLKKAISVAKEKKINIAGIIAVDLFGLPADYDSINIIAHEENLWTIADSAQSLGATNGKLNVGSMAKITTTSFFPAKPLGCYGDGGCIFTNDDILAKKMRSIRVHGKGDHKYDIVQVGLNARLDTLQAAILIEKLKIFSWELKKRADIALYYSDSLRDILDTPNLPKNFQSSWAQYTIKFPNTNTRELVAHGLKAVEISTAIYYPQPMHRQNAYSKYALPEIDLPISEKLSSCVLSIPMHPYLTIKQQDHIIRKIRHLMLDQESTPPA